EDADWRRDWLAAQGDADAHSVAGLVDAQGEWQAAVEVALAEWLAGYAVARWSQTETPTQWPDSSLMLVATDGCDVTLTTDDLAGLPCLASRIKAPAAIMAAAANCFVADDIATALATRPRPSARQVISRQDGACSGP